MYSMKDDLEKNTEVIRKLISAECDASGEEAARSQMVLKKLPLKSDREVEKYLGDPVYRYICLGGTFAFVTAD